MNKLIIILLQLTIIVTPRKSIIALLLNILLAKMYLKNKKLDNVVLQYELVNRTFGNRFPSNHYIWKNSKIFQYYGQLMYHSALYANNYNISFKNKDALPEIVFKAPEWNTITLYYKDAFNYGMKINKTTLTRLTHSHLYWADEQKSKNKFNETVRTIENVLSIHRFDLSSPFITDFRYNFSRFLLRELSQTDFTVTFKKSIAEYKPQYGSSRWLCLYNILIFNGLLESGFEARCECIKAAIEEAETEPDSIDKIISALLAAYDSSDFILAKTLLNKIKGKIHFKKFNSLEAYYYLLIGDINNARKIWKRNLSKADIVFANYFKGKKVAIVGPAPTGLPSGEEIDSHDIVIRFNYMGPDATLKKHEYGSKTNVTLYADTFLKVNKDEPQHYIEDLNHYYVKYPFDGFVHTDLKKNKAKILIKNTMFFNKKPNAVPCVLFDILHYEPLKIKLFNSNFFLADRAYHQNYSGVAFNENSSKLPNRLALLTYHDLVSQVSFVRLLWRQGLIDVDDNCANILSMSDAEYMKGMEKYF